MDWRLDRWLGSCPRPDPGPVLSPRSQYFLTFLWQSWRLLSDFRVSRLRPWPCAVFSVYSSLMQLRAHAGEWSTQSPHKWPRQIKCREKNIFTFSNPETECCCLQPVGGVHISSWFPIQLISPDPPFSAMAHWSTASDGISNLNNPVKCAASS